MSEVTDIRIRRGEREWRLRTVKEWSEVVRYLAGKFTDGRDVGGPELPKVEAETRTRERKT